MLQRLNSRGGPSRGAAAVDVIDLEASCEDTPLWARGRTVTGPVTL